MQLKARRAIVIDDDRFMLEFIKAQLEDLQFDVKTAKDGHEAEKMLNSGFDPHLIVVDMIMPVKEGIETIIYFRQIKPEIKVVAISGGGAFRASELLDYATKLGANAVFTKPVNEEKFDKAVVELFSAL